MPLLLGHFGGHNAGDEAILDGTCHLLSGAGVRAARVVTRNPAYRPRTTAPVVLEPVRASPAAVLGAIRRSSGAVLCGGTHFEDAFATRRRLRHYRYLACYLAVLTIARVLRRPAVAIGQGIGPLTHPVGRVLTRTLFAVVPAGTVRDDASLALARRLGARPTRWVRTFDTAAAVPSYTARAGTGRAALAIAPVHHAPPALWDACAAALRTAWPDLGADRIDVVVCRSGTREDDLAAGRAISARLQPWAPTRMTVFGDDAGALVAAFAGTRVVLCARYHALVLAMLAGAVPVVLPAHPKLADTAALVGVPDALIVRECSAGAIARALRAAAELDARKLRPALDDLRDALGHDRALLTRAVPR
jgi:polysaccharide pyruvyl transferase WcaK-like protein